MMTGVHIFQRMTRVYKKKQDTGLSENEGCFVLKTSGDLPQDLNKIKGGELKDNNTSFSFSVSFFNNIGTDKTKEPDVFSFCVLPPLMDHIFSGSLVSIVPTGVAQ